MLFIDSLYPCEPPCFLQTISKCYNTLTQVTYIIDGDQITPADHSPELETPTADGLPEDQSKIVDEEWSDLLAYAEAVAAVGEKISEAGEAFGESAIAYRNREITLEQFRNKFSSFKSKVGGLIEKIDSLSPPPAAAAVHQKLTGGLAKCNDAIDLMDEWFDTRSSDTKEATVLLVAECMDQVNEAADDLEALVNQ